MKYKKLKINIVASVILQCVTIISGFIIPQIILKNFGSNVNGLISSINQFLSYVTLLEGGISSVIMSILYKPLSENDEKRVSRIINATTNFFKILSIIYILYVIVLGFIYPLLVDTGFTYEYSVLLIWILAFNMFFQYFLSISYKLLLNADRKIAYVSFVQSIVVVLNIIFILICVKFWKDIAIIKLISAIVFLIQPIAYMLYVKKHYKIKYEDGLDEYTLKHRWDGVGINTAYFIHANTDIVVLTVFASLTDVSIYAIYLLIVKALKSIVSSISNAIVPSFGKILVTSTREESNKIFAKYEFCIQLITIIIFTCAMVLITPFVDVYTSDITDANYHQVLFGVLIVFSELVYCYRDPYVSASYAAGHIKQVSKYAYVEAVINIILSIILVKFIGLIGVAIGTIVAMLYRTIAQVLYLRKNILHRTTKIFIKNTMLFFSILLLSLMVTNLCFDMNTRNYYEWFILGTKVFIVVTIFSALGIILFNREIFIETINSVFRKDK